MKLQFKFLVPVFLLFGAFFVLFFITDHRHSEKAMEQTILSQARSLDRLIRASRLVYHSEFLASDFSVNQQTQVFLPSHTMRKISEKLAELSPDNSIRFRSITTVPVNKLAKATRPEKRALDFFATHPQAEELFEPTVKEDQLYYQYFSPTYFHAYCNTCHPNTTVKDGDLNGVLSITLSAEHLRVQTLQRQNMALIILLASLALCGFTTIWLFRRLIHRKLNTLRAISQNTGSGNYDAAVSVGGNDELDDVILSMNQMSAAIAEREAEILKSHEFSSAILSNISDAVSVIDCESSKIVAANQAFLDMHNVTYSEAIGHLCHEVTRCQSLDNDSAKSCPGMIAASTKQPCRKERFRTTGDTISYFDVSASPINNANNTPVQVVRVARNITENKQQEAQIRKLAYYDALTGLPNRTLFHDRLSQALLQCERENSHGAIAFLDLDLFKSVNDSYGHAAGDMLLKVVAKRLMGCVRESDTVARIGGDEFLLILRDLKDRDSAVILLEQLIESIRKPITLNTEIINTSASVGLCFYPQHGTTIDDLLKCADGAMYDAKRSGRNTYTICD
ncbi:diguanylate cyclase domain-containing protein [Desulfuromonas acetoxidans]|uniref:Diguanylate cyclase with PAS/PAC sensor n=1 Tax=Desulfuromonas acetoxidans (strain DSM 684 / 11070) TaxID=281689 RepID=Q1K490_DESA6|nr:diguanylate cyclase [Desulfuromonas acetoxidans]EAT17213.1 diguanylate cyclase with PAS/PAC sensor [Desulfuromonas acetoxidans DSM 684]MBF0645391.1 diguanylate cyclase [Desulfuromonas acetoxidans]NVD24197.1 diguanylate cyclase [Desulfuromonas acetoxidans]NVE15030.1 diguanylate cyclase [Desulfuromonas acetoxidans]